MAELKIQVILLHFEFYCPPLIRVLTARINLFCEVVRTGHPDPLTGGWTVHTKWLCLPSSPASSTHSILNGKEHRGGQEQWWLANTLKIEYLNGHDRK